MLKPLLTLKNLKPFLMEFIQRSPRQVFIVFVLMILNGLTSGIGILMIIPLLSSIGIELNAGQTSSDIANADGWISNIFASIGITPSLTIVLAIYLLIIGSVACLGYATAIMSARMRMEFVDNLRNRLYRSVLYAEWQFLTSERIADFSRMLTGQVQSLGYSIQQLLNLASRLILILIYLAMSVLLSPIVTLLACICSIALFLILIPFNKRIHNSGRMELSSYSDIFRAAIEQLSSLKIIKSYSAENQYLEQMQSTSKILETQQTKLAQYQALSRWVNLVGAAIIFALLFYIAIKIIAVPLANLILLLLIFSRLMPQFSAIQASIQQIIHSVAEYADLLEKTDKLAAHQEAVTQDNSPPAFQHQLSFKQLEHRYPDKNEPALSILNAEIKKNQTVAICGSSGAGKSTLADIIAGLITAEKGQFLVDDTEINEANRMAWRQKVAYVTQDVFLFNDSIRANLAWVNNASVSDERLWQCLKMAAADEFIRKLPQGLDTLIGDRGVRLSGGEKQRLALARALLSEPEILILDEATNALDRDNESKIQDAIFALKGKLTIVVIAHDQKTFEHAEQLIDLDKR